jgi:acylphosphatase
MVRREVQFVGTVQGVGFRAMTRGLAAGRPVTGWVRNEPDGSVICQAQGEPGEVDGFIAAILEHAGTLVRSHDTRAIPTVEGESQFRIAR